MVSEHSTPDKGTSAPPHPWARVLLLTVCVAGIWISYLTQGVVQENLSTKLFAPDGKRFQHLEFLNLAQSIACFLVAFILLPIFNRAGRPQPSLLEYCSPSVTNSIGPACGLIALKFISYPAQVLAKSSKMIPVMLVGASLYGVRYSLPEYCCTLLVAGGVSAFALFKGSTKSLEKLASPNAPLGYGLCFTNLVLDGFTNATQDAIAKRHPHTSAYHMMMGMNAWGSLYMALYMFLWPSGGGWEALSFCASHPEAAIDIVLFCVCGAVGQNFIFLTIGTFGALVNTTVTTTRKFMSILISSVWSGNALTSEQWVGVAMVFSGLGYQIYLKWSKSKNGRRRPKGEAVAHGSENGAAVAVANGVSSTREEGKKTQ